jgi:hypothetical protein
MLNFEPQNVEFRSAGPTPITLLQFEILHSTFCGSKLLLLASLSIVAGVLPLMRIKFPKCLE